MLIALSSILPVLAALVCGSFFTRLDWHFVLRRINGLTDICLYALLVMMGVSVGQVQGIFQKLEEVGLLALLVAISSSLGVALALAPLLVWSRPRNAASSQSADHTFNHPVNEAPTPRARLGVQRILHYAKDPLQLLGLVGIGFLLAYCQMLPSINYNGLVSILLYVLIFLIGIKLSQSAMGTMAVFFNRRGLLIAALTMVGTYAGLLVLAWLSGRTPSSTLVLGSGFGWYTLSGIMLTQLGDPLLGSTAFFADVFREVFALVLVPILARTGAAPIAIGVCGATSMDVTLPVIERHCATDQVPVAFASGAIITLLVPFLIPASYFLGH